MYALSDCESELRRGGAGEFRRMGDGGLTCAYDGISAEVPGGEEGLWARGASRSISWGVGGLELLEREDPFDMRT